jgi:hypothetical protein
LKIKFLGIAEGSWKSMGSSFSIFDNDTISAVHPVIVFHTDKGSTVESGASSRKKTPRNFTVLAKETDIQKNIRTKIFTFEASGTTTSFRENAMHQAENIWIRISANRWWSQ